MAETKVITKQLAGAQDIVRGIGTVNQQRSTGIKVITKMNSSELQGALVVATIAERDALVIADLGDTKTVVVTSITEGGVFNYVGAAWVKTMYGLQDLYTKTEAAALNGSTSEVFKVSGAVSNDDAVNKGQIGILADDYEDGTFSGTINGSTYSGTYIKVGKLVNIECTTDTSSSSGDGGICVLPFAPSVSIGVKPRTNSASTNIDTINTYSNTTSMYYYNVAGSQVSPAPSGTIRINFSYRIA